MKAIRLLGMIACASVCASSYAATTTTDWFSGGASGSSLTKTDATWKQGTTEITAESQLSDITVAEGVITLDNDDSTKLSLVPTAAEPALNDGLVTITSTAVLTPSDYDSLEEVSGAHAGFTVVNGETDGKYLYCGYASGETAKKWVKFSTGPENESDSTTFTIQIDYRTHKVTFLAGTTTLQDSNGTTEFSIGSTYTGLSSVDAFGSGSLTSIATKYENAVCAVGTTKYGSLVDAIAANGTAATILDVTESGISQSVTAGNGLPVAVCKALGISTTEENAAVAIAPVASDTDTSHITLALDSSVKVEDGVAVKFAVKKGETTVGTYASDAIKIPLAQGTGVYTIEPAAVELATTSAE